MPRSKAIDPVQPPERARRRPRRNRHHNVRRTRRRKVKNEAQSKGQHGPVDDKLTQAIDYRQREATDKAVRGLNANLPISKPLKRHSRSRVKIQTVPGRRNVLSQRVTRLRRAIIASRLRNRRDENKAYEIVRVMRRFKRHKTRTGRVSWKLLTKANIHREYRLGPEPFDDPRVFMAIGGLNVNELIDCGVLKRKKRPEPPLFPPVVDTSSDSPNAYYDIDQENGNDDNRQLIVKSTVPKNVDLEPFGGRPVKAETLHEAVLDAHRKHKKNIYAHRSFFEERERKHTRRRYREFKPVKKDFPGIPTECQPRLHDESLMAIWPRPHRRSKAIQSPFLSPEEEAFNKTCPYRWGFLESTLLKALADYTLRKGMDAPMPTYIAFRYNLPIDLERMMRLMDVFKNGNDQTILVELLIIAEDIPLSILSRFDPTDTPCPLRASHPRGPRICDAELFFAYLILNTSRQLHLETRRLEMPRLSIGLTKEESKMTRDLRKNLSIDKMAFHTITSLFIASQATTRTPDFINSRLLYLSTNRYWRLESKNSIPLKEIDEEDLEEPTDRLLAESMIRNLDHTAPLLPMVMWFLEFELPKASGEHKVPLPLRKGVGQMRPTKTKKKKDKSKMKNKPVDGSLDHLNPTTRRLEFWVADEAIERHLCAYQVNDQGHLEEPLRRTNHCGLRTLEITRFLREIFQVGPEDLLTRIALAGIYQQMVDEESIVVLEVHPHLPGHLSSDDRVTNILILRGTLGHPGPLSKARGPPGWSHPADRPPDGWKEPDHHNFQLSTPKDFAEVLMTLGPRPRKEKLYQYTTEELMDINGLKKKIIAQLRKQREALNAETINDADIPLSSELPPEESNAIHEISDDQMIDVDEPADSPVPPAVAPMTLEEALEAKLASVIRQLPTRQIRRPIRPMRPGCKEVPQSKSPAKMIFQSITDLDSDEGVITPKAFRTSDEMIIPPDRGHWIGWESLSESLLAREKERLNGRPEPGLMIVALFEQYDESLSKPTNGRQFLIRFIKVLASARFNGDQTRGPCPPRRLWLIKERLLASIPRKLKVVASLFNVQPWDDFFESVYPVPSGLLPIHPKTNAHELKQFQEYFAPFSLDILEWTHSFRSLLGTLPAKPPRAIRPYPELRLGDILGLQVPHRKLIRMRLVMVAKVFNRFVRLEVDDYNGVKTVLKTVAARVIFLDEKDRHAIVPLSSLVLFPLPSTMEAAYRYLENRKPYDPRFDARRRALAMDLKYLPNPIYPPETLRMAKMLENILTTMPPKDPSDLTPRPPPTISSTKLFQTHGFACRSKPSYRCLFSVFLASRIFHGAVNHPIRFWIFQAKCATKRNDFIAAQRIMNIDFTRALRRKLGHPTAYHQWVDRQSRLSPTIPLLPSLPIPSLETNDDEIMLEDKPDAAIISAGISSCKMDIRKEWVQYKHVNLSDLFSAPPVVDKSTGVKRKQPNPIPASVNSSQPKKRIIIPHELLKSSKPSPAEFARLKAAKASDKPSVSINLSDALIEPDIQRLSPTMDESTQPGSATQPPEPLSGALPETHMIPDLEEEAVLSQPETISLCAPTIGEGKAETDPKKKGRGWQKCKPRGKGKAKVKMVTMTTPKPSSKSHLITGNRCVKTQIEHPVAILPNASLYAIIEEPTIPLVESTEHMTGSTTSMDDEYTSLSHAVKVTRGLLQEIVQLDGSDYLIELNAPSSITEALSLVRGTLDPQTFLPFGVPCSSLHTGEIHLFCMIGCTASNKIHALIRRVLDQSGWRRLSGAQVLNDFWSRLTRGDRFRLLPNQRAVVCFHLVIRPGAPRPFAPLNISECEAPLPVISENRITDDVEVRSREETLGWKYDIGTVVKMKHQSKATPLWVVLGSRLPRSLVPKYTKTPIALLGLSDNAHFDVNEEDIEPYDDDLPEGINRRWHPECDCHLRESSFPIKLIQIRK